MTETASLLVRTWNIAHGRDVPPGPGYGHARRKLLAEMCAVMVEDEPDIVLLQEVPVWAGSLLREETGMGVTLAHAYGAHVPFLHVPLPLAAGAVLGKALPDVVRTQFEGQGQALLYGPDLLLVSARRVQLNERRRLRGEPRVAQLVRLRHRRSGRELVVGNVHADHGDANGGALARPLDDGSGGAAGGDRRGGPCRRSGDARRRRPVRRPARPERRGHRRRLLRDLRPEVAARPERLGRALGASRPARPAAAGDTQLSDLHGRRGGHAAGGVRPVRRRDDRSGDAGRVGVRRRVGGRAPRRVARLARPRPRADGCRPRPARRGGAPRRGPRRGG